MVNQEEISETLAVAFEHIRALHATLSAVMIDLAVLRHFVLKSPETSRQYHRTLALEVLKVKPLVASRLFFSRSLSVQPQNVLGGSLLVIAEDQPYLSLTAASKRSWIDGRKPRQDC
jgi:hypothetical protein